MLSIEGYVCVLMVGSKPLDIFGKNGIPQEASMRPNFWRPYVEFVFGQLRTFSNKEEAEKALSWIKYDWEKGENFGWGNELFDEIRIASIEMTIPSTRIEEDYLKYSSFVLLEYRDQIGRGHYFTNLIGTMGSSAIPPFSTLKEARLAREVRKELNGLRHLVIAGIKLDLL